MLQTPRSLISLLATLGLLGLLMSGLLLVRGCQRQPKHYKQKVQAVHLKDKKKWVSHDPRTDKWRWLVKAAKATAEALDEADFFDGDFAGNDPPSGYVWVSHDRCPAVPANPSADEKAEITEIEAQHPEQVVQEELVVDEHGNPEVDADGNLVDADQLAPDTPYDSDSNSSDSSSDSGSSDSGGDSGGGDGGE
jgi:hypothetical protein